ncbi:MAG: hypothetical protein ACRD1R_14385, partial [Acidobacteriota bacterium]
MENTLLFNRKKTAGPMEMCTTAKSFPFTLFHRPYYCNDPHGEVRLIQPRPTGHFICCKNRSFNLLLR